MPFRKYVNLFLGRRIERTDPLSALLAAPTELPAATHGASWLVQLRWAAAIGQLITIAFVRLVLGVPLPVGPLLTVVGITALSNLALAIWSSSRPEVDERRDRVKTIDATTVPVLGLVLLLDLLLLTVLLSFSGGPTNPFYIFYFVNLCLSAVVLPRGWAWAGCFAAIVCFVVLFFSYRPLPEMWTAAHLEPIQAGDSVTRAHAGLLIAFMACAVVVVYFTSLLRDQLQKSEHQIRAFHADRARTQKLEALGTLAAGAAHELANPLGTIAVVAREVERRVGGTPVEPKVAKDISLIRSELETCRNILKRMSADAGQAIGEELIEVTAGELIGESLEGLRETERVAVTIDPAAEDTLVVVPLVGLAQAIRGIIQNALAASANVQQVRVKADRSDGRLRLLVRDEGVGMPPAVLARVGDPFFTTKDPGRGTGLGVFLARAVVERLGGKLTI
ncbi:MAG: ATP-binding protein, partial [Planctomycetota bacterium]|nr:ATP-binding protein [Planctomycetota bacterium]